MSDTGNRPKDSQGEQDENDDDDGAELKQERLPTPQQGYVYRRRDHFLRFSLSLLLCLSAKLGVSLLFFVFPLVEWG
jgi:hypothetical protein